MVQYGTHWRAILRSTATAGDYHSKRLNGSLWRVPGLHAGVGRHLHVGTVYAPAASSKLDDLIKQIPIAPLNDRQSEEDNRSLLLVLSPAFVKHARDPNVPLSIAQHIHNGELSNGSLTSITAVVDGVAGTPGLGSEGLAYIYRHDPHFKATSQTIPLRLESQKAGSIQFNFANAVEQQMWRFQLPLRQTVFSTGLTSTLIRRRYNIDNDGNIKGPVAESNLERLNYRLPASRSESALDIEHPLIQLTSYRAIGHSMGNIIRTVTALDTNAEEPASRNLEEAVSAYFEALNKSPEPVNVWALIIPKSILLTGKIDKLAQDLVLEQQALHALWNAAQHRNADQGDSTLKALLQHRARLVKVLSGGGGWGKKAGLLSLDPDLEYSTRELRNDHGWTFDFEQTESEHNDPKSLGRQIDQALGASAEEGDGIVFFISPSEIDPASTSQQASEPLANRYFFAVSPTVNSLEDVNKPSSTNPAECRLRSNFFGITSETGLALKVSEDESYWHTKLEVPGLNVVVQTTDVSS